MRLTILIDNYHHEIDTTDPELLGKWIVEIFGRMPGWYPSTYVQMQAHPSFVQDKNGIFTADWITDSTIIGRITQLQKPRDLLTKLEDQLKEWEIR